MVQDVLKRENMVYHRLYQYLHDDEKVVEVKDRFGKAENFELNPKRPRKVHVFIFRTQILLDMFKEYEDLFKDYPYFKVNVTQAKVMPYITYDLKDKALIETEKYQAFKKLYNEKYGNYLQKLVDKTSRMQCYRLKGTESIFEMRDEADVETWMDTHFQPVMNIVK